ncbi:acetyl/propionyl/methylcrotonyl-CoA carboxylase subunit alpha [Pseudomonas gingeri]|uniref:acetyl/propionyl/methylcrotonyl-CoA carboxylase subunit alpha n=1 Tax=Pseudomonas gingeri TaxID=117681 RepID=UPI0015A221C8|nr:acetyl/propionyl/methylcrotonyl-CoA carboxylase subunit alpha [Pseudomonas gingeri]NWA00101.1 acetyl/propionyl/methylcrotonyl-CoA carboxylase subunit alpha [Pseudomonas gingeri]NWA16940.1 acetyl/propionyl/methylcrotonyl-CoA carboxylase subunit alpha [Pseudomonas gingeri]NWA53674.1 acetyl/propionyl/methylcrotonyl-CoA carboxylase subunit alpha [Pseudomonas gingeri]NWA93906.1 acetyl/propionyl/methylcrotonyl-CoA carboxylase subunit alpha [Pseudomonas gingeri]NWB02194.1 acetyl/propionyl/methylcr
MPAFHKILIANRGEIACRVIRTAKAQGYRTVAVFSEADAGARHVQLADEAVCIGASQVAQSYLDSAALLDAARRCGADAIHPGYGFLSENAAFARACQDVGIIFIGPSPEAIDLMGNKRRSKIAMLAAGVPCIAGYQGAEQDDATLAREATRIGYPLMIKASAGGGGRGMRLVDDPAQLLAQLRTARSEALHAFGYDELILEQALIEPRHVEIQLFGDQYGNLLYLGERDCSIQRRHQKIIEEAPCPVMTGTLRQAMGEAALQAGRAVNYVGAGTVEFLLDARGRFYFLEMNTRLQVEHPVTELITGLDLVAWQLDVAAGLPLPLRQEQIMLQGHAIEVRLYAEDPTRDFLPQTGQLLGWEPDLAGGVRVDHGLLEGQDISPFYDPLLGKLIAHGATREEARRKLLRAVEDCVLLGLASNQRLLANLLGHPTFVAGDFSTAFIGEHFSADPSLQAYQPSSAELALAAVLFHEARAARHAGRLANWRNGPGVPRHYRLGLGETTVDLQLLVSPNTPLRVRHADREIEVRVLERDSRWVTVELDGIQRRHAYRLEDEQLWLFTRPGSLHLRDLSLAPVENRGTASSGTVKAPMDGAIVEVLVSEGSQVRKGQLLMVLEAMKMEHPLKAAIDGVVRRVQAGRGDQVKNRQILLVVE